MNASSNIEHIDLSNEPLPADLALTLIKPDTREQARLATLAAIATPATIERRDILLGRAKEIAHVTGDDDVKVATEVAGLLKGLRNDIERARKLIKDPALDICRAIDGVAIEIKADAETEMNRLERLMGDYALRKAQERVAEQRRLEEEARREREKAEREAAEARRIEEEARAKAEAVGVKSDTSEADLLEALEAEEKAEEAAARAAEAEAHAATPVYAPVIARDEKIAGAAVAKDWDYEIVDIAALYAAKPECVELKPRASIIKAIIKTAAEQAAGNPFHIPGLRVSPKVKVATRAR